MRIVDIIPKDIAILTEFSPANLDSLIYCLERCEIKIDSADDKAHTDYFSDTFYNTLVELRDRLNNVD